MVPRPPLHWRVIMRTPRSGTSFGTIWTWIWSPSPGSSASRAPKWNGPRTMAQRRAGWARYRTLTDHSINLTSITGNSKRDLFLSNVGVRAGNWAGQSSSPGILNHISCSARSVLVQVIDPDRLLTFGPGSGILSMGLHLKPHLRLRSRSCQLLPKSEEASPALP